MAGGMSEAEILTDFPSLKADHVRAVLMFAAQRVSRNCSRCLGIAYR